MNLKLSAAFAAKHGDTSVEAYEALGDVFLKAHRDAPGGLTIEVGTRRGGSAVLMLELLWDLYPDGQPAVISIDPYGGKPYLRGSPSAPVIQGQGGLYNDEDYLAAKALLAGYPHHLLFPITSLDFLTYVYHSGLRIWRREQCLFVTQQSLTCVYLDGDHDAATIVGEVQGFFPLLKVGGCIVIDNLTDDPFTVQALGQVLDKLQGGRFQLHEPLPQKGIIWRVG